MSGHIDDAAEGGWWPLQHHDPERRNVTDRRHMGGVRVHQQNGDHFTPAGQTYGDIQGGLLWEESGGKREHLHSWFFTPPGAVNMGGAEFFLPIRGAGGTPDERYAFKAPVLPGYFKGTLPKGHTGTITAGTEEYSQQETFHPDWLNFLAAVNANEPTSAGTHVCDLNPDGTPGPSAPLQRVFSVLDDSIAWQFGRGGNLDGGATNGYGLVINYDQGEGAFLSANQGGPLTTGAPWCLHGARANLAGYRIKPGHISTGAFFCGPQGDGPLDFDGEPYPPNARDLPQQVAAHIRFDGAEFKIHSSCSFFIPDPPEDDDIGFKPSPTGKPGKQNPPPFFPPPQPPGGPMIGFKPSPTGSVVGPGSGTGEGGSIFGPTGGGIITGGGGTGGGVPITPPPFGPTPFGETQGGGGGQFVTDKTQHLLQPLIGDTSKPTTPHSTTCLAVPNIEFKGTASQVGQVNIPGAAVVTNDQRRLFVNAPTAVHLQAWTKGDGTWEGFQPYTHASSESHAKGAGGLMVLPPDATAHGAINGTATTQHTTSLLAVTGLSSFAWGSPSISTGGVKSGFVSTCSGGSTWILQAKSSTGAELGFLGATNDGDWLGFNSSGGVNFSLTNGLLTLPAITTPSTPASTYGGFYTKASSPTKPYFISDDGTEYDLTSGSGGNEFEDDVFRINDDSDPTKQLAFQCSGITAGQTRTLTVPNASGTIALLSLAQAWTATQTFQNQTQFNAQVVIAHDNFVLDASRTDAGTNDVQPLAYFSRLTSGTAAAGLGGYFVVNIENDNGSGVEALQIGALLTDASNGSEDADLTIGLIAGGSTAERLRVTAAGAMRNPETSAPGTPASGFAYLHASTDGYRAVTDAGVTHNLASVDWTDYTPTCNWTNTTVAGKYKRVGDTGFFQISLTLTGTPAGVANLLIDPLGALGLTADESKLLAGSGRSYLGAQGGVCFDASLSAHHQVAAVSWLGGASDDAEVWYANGTTQFLVDETSAPFTWTTNDVMHVWFALPISEWDS